MTSHLDNVPPPLDSTEVLDVVPQLRDCLCGQEVKAGLLPGRVAEPLHAQDQEAASGGDGWLGGVHIAWVVEDRVVLTCPPLV